MKKLRLKKGAKVILIIIDILALLIMASECESMLWFVISHLLACVIFIITSIILIEHS